METHFNARCERTDWIGSFLYSSMYFRQSKCVHVKSSFHCWRVWITFQRQQLHTVPPFSSKLLGRSWVELHWRHCVVGVLPLILCLDSRTPWRQDSQPQVSDNACQYRELLWKLTSKKRNYRKKVKQKVEERGSDNERVQYAFKHGRKQRKKITVAADYQKSAKGILL